MLPGLTRSLPAHTQAPARARLWLHGFGSSETGNERASQPRYPVLVISPFPGHSNQLNRTPPGHTPSPRTCAHEPQGHLSCAPTPAGLPQNPRAWAEDGPLRDTLLLGPHQVRPGYCIRNHTPQPPTLSHRAQLCANGQLLLTALKTLEALESVQP